MECNTYTPCSNKDVLRWYQWRCVFPTYCRGKRTSIGQMLALLHHGGGSSGTRNPGKHTVYHNIRCKQAGHFSVCLSITMCQPASASDTCYTYLRFKLRFNERMALLDTYRRWCVLPGTVKSCCVFLVHSQAVLFFLVVYANNLHTYTLTTCYQLFTQLNIHKFRS